MSFGTQTTRRGVKLIALREQRIRCSERTTTPDGALVPSGLGLNKRGFDSGQTHRGMRSVRNDRFAAAGIDALELANLTSCPFTQVVTAPFSLRIKIWNVGLTPAWSPFGLIDLTASGRLMETADANRGGFIAGTLVWTRDGQVKIEQLQVGDLVRVQDVAGAAKLQPVARVYTLPEQPVYELLYFVDDGSDEQLPIYATGGISVLTDDGWCRFESRGRDEELQLADGLKAILVLSQPVRRTTYPRIGYVALDEYETDARVLDFDDEAMELHGHPAREVTRADGTASCLLVTVHGFELAEGRTFYVGHCGVLAQDGLA